MKKYIVSVGLIAFLFYGCEEVFFEDDISKVTIELIAPVDNTVFDTQNINLNWTPIEGAEEYQLQIATPSFLNAGQIVIDTILTKTSFEIELSPGEYQWRAKGINSAYNTNYSTNSFSIISLNFNETVNLVSPENNLITNISTQTLSWDSLEFADDYRLQILKDDGTNELVFDVTTAENTKTMAFQDGSYNWQVRAQNGTQQTEYTKRNILIDTKLPNIPSQIAPSNSSGQVEKVIHFQYERLAVEGSAETDSLFVFTDAALTNLALKTAVINNSHFQEFATGTYYWYLKAYDKAGNKSAKSTVRSFTILEDFTLKTVGLISPANELITNTAQQTLQWNAIEGALDYRVLIHKVNSAIILKDDTLPITSKTITFEDGYYTWKVRAQNTTQNTQYTSRNILIDTSPPNISVLESPANEQILNNTTVHFIWNRETMDGSAEKSTVYVYADAGLTNLVFSSEASENSLYRNLVPGIYYWYVKTTDEAGNSSSNSVVFSFTVE